MQNMSWIKVQWLLVHWIVVRVISRLFGEYRIEPVAQTGLAKCVPTFDEAVGENGGENYIE